MPTNLALATALAREIDSYIVEASTQAMVLLQRGAHQGLGSAAPARIKKGELRAGGGVAVNADSSWRPPSGRFTPPKTDADVRASLRRMEPGDRAAWTSRVPHAQRWGEYLAPVADQVPAAMDSWRPKPRSAP